MNVSDSELVFLCVSCCVSGGSVLVDVSSWCMFGNNVVLIVVSVIECLVCMNSVMFNVFLSVWIVCDSGGCVIDRCLVV